MGSETRGGGRAGMRDFEALTFDCYGTLIDWERGLLSELRPWAEEHALSASDDQLLSAFAEAEPRMQAEAPDATYPDILRGAHRLLAERFGVKADDKWADRLANSVGDWPAFNDTAEALERLKGLGRRLVIVSNVDHASFERTQQALGVEFDGVVTAEEAGSYKPAEGHFKAALALLGDMGIGKEQILHTAQSLFHDHLPAQRLGLQTAWIDRRGEAEGSGGGATAPVPGGAAAVKPDFVFASMAALADAFEAAERA